MKVITPLRSDKLADHLDPISYELFKNYEGIENAEKIKPLIDAAYFFDIVPFKRACLITLGCPFYIGPTEADKEKFREKWGVGEI